MISLVSDTETRPSQAMRSRMAEAEVGDEQRREDPTVNKLLRMVAESLGKEKALFLPSGTMCNIVAVKTHTQPGQVVFAERMAHVIRAESGGPAFHSGVLMEAVHGRRGVFQVEDLEEAYARLLAAPFPHGPKPGLVCVEQTHNFGGGAIWSLEELTAIKEQAARMALPVHMDGARLFNAVVKSGISARQFAQTADSIWIDFTKGLGALLGAVLAGPADFIEEARYYKHLFGGAMRQAGFAAAGCIYALENNVERLRDDHENASILAEGLSEIPGIDLITPEPETNIVFFSVEHSGLATLEFLDRIQAKGVRMGAVAGGVRACTHLDVSRADVRTAVEIIRDVVS